jgi:hypothetical protein
MSAGNVIALLADLYSKIGGPDLPECEPRTGGRGRAHLDLKPHPSGGPTLSLDASSARVAAGFFLTQSPYDAPRHGAAPYISRRPLLELERDPVDHKSRKQKTSVASP